MVIHVVSAVSLFFLGMMWNKETLPNFSLKMLLLCLAIWHAWEAITVAGYVVRV